MAESRGKTLNTLNLFDISRILRHVKDLLEATFNISPVMLKVRGGHFCINQVWVYWHQIPCCTFNISRDMLKVRVENFNISRVLGHLHKKQCGKMI